MRETERDKLDLADKKRQISRDSCGGSAEKGSPAKLERMERNGTR